MIQCPECAKELADDSAHCGFCGAKIETGTGKKTMMGFAALTGDTLQQAAAEAKAARQAAEAARSPTGLPSRPTKPAEDSRPKIPQLPKPTPISGLPAAAPSNPLNVGSSDADSDARTAVMGAVTAPSTVTEDAVSSDTDPMPSQHFDDNPKTVPTAAPAPVTRPEHSGPLAAPDGPSEFGAGPVDDGPSEFGSGQIDFAHPTLPEAKKKTNPAIMVVGALVVLMLFCCFASLAYNIILPIVMAL